jgi:rSAM/selenodomain-associated transferase 1
MSPASIMTKVPVIGHVKTRLSNALGPEGACALHTAMAGDVGDLCVEAAVDFRWVVAGDLSHPWVKQLNAPVQGQKNGDLGERIWEAIGERGFALGSDAPTLPPAWITQAANSRADVILGPASDGGCWVIGWNKASPRWLRNIPWSTDRVFDTLLERARSENLLVDVLESWYDVDEPADIEHLVNHLAHLPEDRDRRTRQILATLGG